MTLAQKLESNRRSLIGNEPSIEQQDLADKAWAEWFMADFGQSGLKGEPLLTPAERDSLGFADGYFDTPSCQWYLDDDYQRGWLRGLAQREVSKAMGYLPQSVQPEPVTEVAEIPF